MIPRSLILTSMLTAALLLAGCGGDSPSDSPSARTGGGSGPQVDPRSGEPISLHNRVKEAIDRGLTYLHGQFDATKGGWTVQGKADPGITGLVVQAFAMSPRKYTDADGPFMEKALAFLASLAHPDGSIHDGQLANYKTSAAVQALVSAGGGKYRDVVEKAREYLVNSQLDSAEGFSEDHKFYGGAGYGDDRRPDMSNLSLWVDGLLAAGQKRGSEPFQRALHFLERCQNDSEVNTARYEIDGKVVVSGDDGGGVYAPGVSKAGLVDRGEGVYAPRSYGSMTYALLKGYIAADLKADDPRVQKALDWIAHNFTLKENPGFDSANPKAGLQGLYYYYFTMAKALDLRGQDVVKDAQGRDRRWREELASRLLELQAPDGSWVNGDSPRWWEGMPVLATAYAVQALDICYKGLK
jgi:squalene-hopene/tetraprenyl-beta-curcumene cyclase